MNVEFSGRFAYLAQIMQTDLQTHKLSVPSETTPDTIYEIDLDAGTCTCPYFTGHEGKKGCKHLTKLGISAPGKKDTTNYTAQPKYHQAISAVIKAVRLRRPEQAIYWLYYCWQFPKRRFVLLRRIATLAAEDGQNIPTKIRGLKILPYLKSNELDSDFFAAAREIYRICQKPNWWQIPDGTEYTYVWALRYKDKMNGYHPYYQGMEYDELLKYFKTYVLANNFNEAMKPYLTMQEENGYSHKKFIEELDTMAAHKNSLEAKMNLAVLKGGKRIFNMYSNNYWGQVIYRLCHYRLGDQEPPHVDNSDVKEIIEKVEHKWQNDPEIIPKYYMDGMHTYGIDTRFSGIGPSMWGVCKAYNYFGRVHQDDEWPPQLWIHREPEEYDL